MILRLCKLALVAAVAFFLTLVVFNNLTDYDSNYHFVEHVLSMDTTFPNNHGKWRALNSGLEDTLFYAMFIAWEAATAVFCWWGTFNGLRHLKSTPSIFRRAKNPAVIGLTLSLLQWFVAFLSVGGEWFLMWQSKIWNGQDAAFRMFACIGIILILRADHRTIAPDQLPLLESFLRDQREFQVTARQELTKRNEHSAEDLAEARILDNFHLLQACDNLSLVTCVDYPHPANLLHALPVQDGGHQPVNVEHLSERHFRLAPYPFAKSPLTIHFPARFIQSSRFASMKNCAKNLLRQSSSS